jgi:hypothetical protein
MNIHPVEIEKNDCKIKKINDNNNNNNNNNNNSNNNNGDGGGNNKMNRSFVLSNTIFGKKRVGIENEIEQLFNIIDITLKEDEKVIRGTLIGAIL